jgi:serine protease inhibitor
LADVNNLDFGDARGSAKTINDWVSQTTNGRIKDLITEESVSNSVILLINALYFEGTWRYSFSKLVQRDFQTTPGRKVARQFMEQTGNFYFFNSRHLNAKILRLPYNGRRFSLFIVLPNEVNGLDGVIDKLDSNALKNEVWHMDELEVHAVIPKFKFDTSLSLNDITKSVSLFDVTKN